jgi:trans-2,3-dihydro-3-hydroxyanthranilate isomerase
VEFDDGAATTDAERRRLPGRAGASHAAFVARTPRADGGIAVRFFTAAGELPGCGHGTVAAQAVLLDAGGFTGRQHTAGRTIDVRATRRPDGIEVYFDQGIVSLRAPTDEEHRVAVDALGGIRPAGDVTVASPGAPRLLVPVADRDALLAAAPDPDALGAATRRLNLLGCFVYTVSTVDERVAARMFAPAIGVREDVANANSTGCLAAHLLVTAGTARIEVEQGDSLGRPATVYAAAEATGDGIRTWVGGLAVIRREEPSETAR